MPPLQKSGMYYPNKFGLITIKSLEEVMGKNGLNAILNLAGLNHYIENYPPDNLDKGFDFAELSAIGSSLEEMYGPRGGRGLALRAGRHQGTQGTQRTPTVWVSTRGTATTRNDR